MKKQTKNRILTQSILSSIFLILGVSTISASVLHPRGTSYYDISSSIYLDGNLVSKPKIKIKTNKKATLVLSSNNSKDSMQVSLIATDSQGSEPINLNYNIKIINQGEIFEYNKAISVHPSKSKTISVSNPKHTFKMIIFPKRIQKI